MTVDRKPAAELRAERPEDLDAISGVIERAFAGHPHSDGSEPRIVAALRAGGALSVSLVALLDDRLVGHIAFSPVEIGDGSARWYGLGPLAVEPSVQRRGIGAALVRRGLAQLAEKGAAGCVVAGDPAYYGRLGFLKVPGLVYPGLPPEYFMAFVLAGDTPAGVVTYDEAFSA